MSDDLDVQDLAPLVAIAATGWTSGLIPALLDEGELRISTLALDPRAAPLLLDALSAFGLTRIDGDRLLPGPKLVEAERWPGSTRFAAELWSRLPGLVRSGEPWLEMDAGAKAREAAYRDVVAGLGDFMAPVARAIAEWLPGAPADILDVGAGSGVFGLAMAEVLPRARVTALDLPGVLPRFLDRADRLGLRDRVATIAGDFHEVALEEGSFDRIVVANVLHLEPEERARALIERLACALRPKGQLVICGSLGTGTPARDRARAVYALHLALRTRQGRNHPAAEIAAWCREAGLSVGDEAPFCPDLTPRALAAILSVRPS